MENDVFTELKVYRRVETLAGHADSAYAVSCGYALMRFGNPHDFYAVSCGCVHIFLIPRVYILCRPHICVLRVLHVLHLLCVLRILGPMPPPGRQT